MVITWSSPISSNSRVDLMTEFKCTWARLQPVLRGGCGYFVLSMPEMRLSERQWMVSSKEEVGHLFSLLGTSYSFEWKCPQLSCGPPHGKSNRCHYLLASENILFEWIATSLWDGDKGNISSFLLRNEVPVERRQVITFPNKILRRKDCVYHLCPSGPGRQICRRRDGARWRAERREV